LLSLEEPQLEIVQISNNTQELLGIAPEQLLNQPLSKLLGTRQASVLKRSLGGDFNSINPLRISLKQSGKKLFFDGIIHRYDSVAMLELLPTKSKTPSTFFEFYHLVKTATDQIQQATTTAALCAVAAKEFRSLTGFDRVMVYKFDAEGAGTLPTHHPKPVSYELQIACEFLGQVMSLELVSQEEKDIESCYRKGANSYIIKPIDFNQLKQSIRVILDFWFTVATLPADCSGAEVS
jgi:light-regulated signal transduction histidine kinase (bacteriophytochrome)